VITASCWHQHVRFRRSTAEWTENTTLIGFMLMHGDGPDIALANCRHGCGTTLARELSPRSESRAGYLVTLVLVALLGLMRRHGI